MSDTQQSPASSEVEQLRALGASDLPSEYEQITKDLSLEDIIYRPTHFSVKEVNERKKYFSEKTTREKYPFLQIKWENTQFHLRKPCVAYNKTKVTCKDCKLVEAYYAESDFSVYVRAQNPETGQWFNTKTLDRAKTKEKFKAACANYKAPHKVFENQLYYKLCAKHRASDVIRLVNSNPTITARSKAYQSQLDKHILELILETYGEEVDAAYLLIVFTYVSQAPIRILTKLQLFNYILRKFGLADRVSVTSRALRVMIYNAKNTDDPGYFFWLFSYLLETPGQFHTMSAMLQDDIETLDHRVVHENSFKSFVSRFNNNVVQPKNEETVEYVYTEEMFPVLVPSTTTFKPAILPQRAGKNWKNSYVFPVIEWTTGNVVHRIKLNLDEAKTYTRNEMLQSKEFNEILQKLGYVNCKLKLQKLLLHKLIVPMNAKTGYFESQLMSYEKTGLKDATNTEIIEEVPAAADQNPASQQNQTQQPKAKKNRRGKRKVAQPIPENTASSKEVLKEKKDTVRKNTQAWKKVENALEEKPVGVVAAAKSLLTRLVENVKSTAEREKDLWRNRINIKPNNQLPYSIDKEDNLHNNWYYINCNGENNDCVFDAMSYLGWPKKRNHYRMVYNKMVDENGGKDDWGLIQEMESKDAISMNLWAILFYNYNKTAPNLILPSFAYQIQNDCTNGERFYPIAQNDPTVWVVSYNGHAYLYYDASYFRNAGNAAQSSARKIQSLLATSEQFKFNKDITEFYKRWDARLDETRTQFSIATYVDYNAYYKDCHQWNDEVRKILHTWNMTTNASTTFNPRKLPKIHKLIDMKEFAMEKETICTIELRQDLEEEIENGEMQKGAPNMPELEDNPYMNFSLEDQMNTFPSDGWIPYGYTKSGNLAVKAAGTVAKLFKKLLKGDKHEKLAQIIEMFLQLIPTLESQQKNYYQIQKLVSIDYSQEVDELIAAINHKQDLRPACLKLQNVKETPVFVWMMYKTAVELTHDEWMVWFDQGMEYEFFKDTWGTPVLDDEETCQIVAIMLSSIKSYIKDVKIPHFVKSILVRIFKMIFKFKYYKTSGEQVSLNMVSEILAQPTLAQNLRNMWDWDLIKKKIEQLSGNFHKININKFANLSEAIISNSQRAAVVLVMAQKHQDLEAKTAINDTVPHDTTAVAEKTGGRDQKWKEREFLYGYCNNDMLAQPLIDTSGKTQLFVEVKDWGDTKQNRTPIGVVDSEFSQGITMPRWETSQTYTTLSSFCQRVALYREEYSDKQLALMRYVTDMMNEDIQPLPADTFFDFEEYLEQNKKWTMAQKQELREHWDLYCATLRIDKNTNMFVKWEPGDEFKVCRMIFSVTLDIKVARGCEIKEVEKWYFDQIANNVKHMRSDERLNYIRETIGELLFDELLKSTDYKRFEHIFTQGMMYAIEYRHMAHMLQLCPSKNHVLKGMFEQSSWSRFINARRTYIAYLHSKRKSGYGETSLENYFTNRVLNTCMYWHMYHDVMNSDPFEIFEKERYYVGQKLNCDAQWKRGEFYRLQAKANQRMILLKKREKDKYLNQLNDFARNLMNLNKRPENIPLDLEKIDEMGISKYLELMGPLSESQEVQYKNYLELKRECNSFYMHKFSAQEQRKEWDMFVTWAETYGYLSRRCFEGDDGLFVVKAEFSHKVDIYYKLVGVTVKSETHKQLNTASFCGLVYDDQSVLFRDPIKTIAKFPVLEPRYARCNVQKMKALMRIKAMSLLSETPSCPIISAYALAVLTFTRDQHEKAVKILNGHGICRGMSSWEYEQFLINMANKDTKWFDLYKRPSQSTFLQFAQTYKLNVEEVIEIHDLFEKAAFNGTVFPRTEFFYNNCSDDWKYYSRNYVFKKNPSDICHAFMLHKMDAIPVGPRNEQGYRAYAFRNRESLKSEEKHAFIHNN